MLIRKYDFPKSVTEALKVVHVQCEKMSQNSLSISQELSQITGNLHVYQHIMHVCGIIVTHFFSSNSIFVTQYFR